MLSVIERLTVKLRGRPEAAAHGAEGAQSLSARGANPEARHGPLQRLLEVGVTITPNASPVSAPARTPKITKTNDK
jgi:hypothetical protein